MSDEDLLCFLCGCSFTKRRHFQGGVIVDLCEAHCLEVTREATRKLERERRAGALFASWDRQARAPRRPEAGELLA